MTKPDYKAEQRMAEKLTHPRMGFVPQVSQTGGRMVVASGVSADSHRAYRLLPTVVATPKGEVMHHQRVRVDVKPARSKKQRRLDRAAAKAAMARPIEEIQAELGGEV